MAKELPSFKISASVVKQLGEELVSDELTAIMELVKNSYDADADWVKININTSETLEDANLTFKNKKGYIIIEDNGIGMDYSDIISKWLFISLSYKKEMKTKGETTVKGRTPLGDKGLGRLSTQRLGHILEMFTGKANNEELHHVGFDYRHFTETIALEEINTNYKLLSKSPEKKITKLIISDLKDPNIWLGDAADKFRGQLSKLIFPFKDKRPFTVYLTINGQKNDLDLINKELRKQAVSKYKFEFDGEKFVVKGLLKLSKLQGNTPDKREIYNQLIQSDNGKDFFDFLTSPINNKKYFLSDIKYKGEEGIFFKFRREFNFAIDVKKEFIIEKTNGKFIPANPGKFYGEIDEFNLSGTDDISAAYKDLSIYKNLVKNQVGVRIFRDGFGIKPYGMEDNDWLKLSKSQTSGGSFYLLRPENVIGFVSISGKENKNLKEKTDREGFIDSPYSKNFFGLINLAIQNINDVLERTRRSYDEYKKKNAETKGEIRSFKDTKERLVKTAKESVEIETQANNLNNEFKSLAIKVGNSVATIKSQPLFSSLQEKNTLSILEEVEGLLKNANNIFNKVNNILQNAKKLENDANYLEPKIQELENQIVQFSELAGLGITAEAFTHELYNIIDRISNQTDQALAQSKKSVSNDIVLFTYAESVKTFVASIKKQLNHLAPSLKYNRETTTKIRVSAFLDELVSYYKIRNTDTIKIDLKVNSDFSIEINKGKLTQIFDNLILNSEYWLKEAKKNDGNFMPVISIEVNAPLINLSDNGFGILPSLEDNLFQPFVTSKPKNIGRGLGLFIIQQLLDSINGHITLLQKRNEYSRRYIFQLNFESILSKK